MVSWIFLIYITYHVILFFGGEGGRGLAGLSIIVYAWLCERMNATRVVKVLSYST